MVEEVTIKKETITKTIGGKNSETKKTSKKVAKKNPIRKKTTRKRATRKKTPAKSEIMQKILIENFVALQRVLTNMSTKFENLSNQISDLLYLFEESAKTVVKRDFMEIDKRKETEDITNKLDSLLNQNKLIAKGLTLMHETAENPEINYAIGSTPKSEIIMQPVQTIQAQQTNQKSLVREEPENKSFETP